MVTRPIGTGKPLEPQEIEPPKARVSIVLTVERENIEAFLSEWEYTVSKLIELARCESAEMVMPSGFDIIPLRTY